MNTSNLAGTNVSVGGAGNSIISSNGQALGGAVTATSPAATSLITNGASPMWNLSTLQSLFRTEGKGIFDSKNKNIT